MPKAQLYVMPIDFSPEMEATVSAAFALARHCGARVDLLEVTPHHGPSLLGDNADTRAARQESAKRDRSRLDTSIHEAERGHIEVRVVSYRGEASRIIPSYVQLKKARLLVIGKHYGSSPWRRTAGIVSNLSRSAPAPVLVLPPPPRSEKRRSMLFGHVVSAVDFTVASAVAMRTALDLIRRTGAQLTLVHAANAPHRMVFSGSEAHRVARNLQGQMPHVAERLRKRIPENVRIRVDTQVTTGDPHRAILDIASQVKADLIVMGVPPRSRFDEVLFGSTLRSVLRRTTIPVLVLPVLAGAYTWLEETDVLRLR